MKVNSVFFASCILLLFAANSLFSQKVFYQNKPDTRSIKEIAISNDSRDMNWIIETDGSQYSWVNEKYGWGLGFFDLEKNGKVERCSWGKPIRVNGKGIYYQTNDVEIKVERKNRGNDLVEVYTFTNKTDEPIALRNVNIYTPFNDNYPNAETCVKARTNAHIWEGLNAGYVYCSHMDGQIPGLGLTIVQGAINGYEIHERGADKGLSNFRGVISLNVQDMELSPNGKDIVSWSLFSHSGKDDFFQKLLTKGSVYAMSNKYVFEKGEKAHLEFHALPFNELKSVTLDGELLKFYKTGKKWSVDAQLNKLGETKIIFNYGNGKQTYVSCWVISDINELMNKRANFIIDNQQLNNKKHLLDGAYLVYDNEENKMVLRDKTLSEFIFPDINRSEGMERLGMGVFLARLYQVNKDEKVKTSLLKYANFVRNRLQDTDYTTWCTVGRVWNRAYNYAWTAVFYFEMYKATNDKQYLNDGYQTLQAMFRHFGYGFYAIEIPVKLSLNLLKDAGMKEEYEKLKSDFIQMGDTFIKNGVNYPQHEVAYEQTIVGPSIMVLTQLYLTTNEQRFLDEAKRQMPLLESFGGYQPSHHLNELPIRHWDAYWCGKDQMWGDTFPHFLSGLSGVIYYDYYLCTGDLSYKKRAENIVRNTLCLFSEDGKASCAYIFPNKVNGVKAKYYEPFASEQDWALAYYLLVNK